jgi:hypothetical protein
MYLILPAPLGPGVPEADVGAFHGNLPHVALFIDVSGE